MGLSNKDKITKDGITFKTYPPQPAPFIGGDGTKAIFLWANKNKPLRSNDEYFKYLKYDYGIANPSSYHKQLINEGLFTDDTGQFLSEKGSNLLTKNDEYIKLHKNRKRWDITLAEYEETKAELTGKGTGYIFNDIIWCIANKRIMSSSNYGSSEYKIMFDVLKMEDKRKQALQTLLNIFIVDLSGVENYDTIKCYFEYQNTDYSDLYDKKYVTDSLYAVALPPFYIKELKMFSDIYTPAIAEDVYNKTNLRLNMCPKELFLEIINSIFSGKYDEKRCSAKLRREYVAYFNNLIGETTYTKSQNKSIKVYNPRSKKKRTLL